MEHTNVQLFEHEEFGSVRVVIIDGEPWFVGKDVAIALGYKEPEKAIREHIPDKFKGVSVLDTPGGKQKVVVINEAGMYRLVFRSKLPAAEKFTDWVCEEVLPSIRKTGAYFVNDCKFKQPPTDFERGVQLKKLASHTRNPELREQLIIEAANLIAGEKIFSNKVF